MFKNKLNMFSKDKSETGNDKKKIENLVFFIVLLIITIVIINIVWNGDKKSNKKQNTLDSKKLAESVNEINNNSNGTINDSSNEIEAKLENILSKIEGVGDVKVFVNYSESSQIIAMYNEDSKVSNIEENDTSGGTRKTQETDTKKDIVYKEENGEKTPITQKVIQPKIEGAIITAKGASNVNVKTNIIQAVEAVTGLAVHKIQVFEMN